MFDFIRISGPFGTLITLVILVNLGLVTWSSVKVAGSGPQKNPALEGKINAILFWGAIGAILGILGQANGIYISTRVIRAAPEISPGVVAEGFGVSFTTVILGFTLLLGSALAWMVLRAVYGRKTRKALPE
ncbi:hypothetical protein ACFL0I_01740 [Gemmatimonadota bacterium]